MTKSSGQKIMAAIAGLAVVGTVSAPFSASAITSNTTVSAVVNSTITMTTSGTVSLTLNPGASAVVSSNSDTVTVNCNDTDGYTLTLADVNADRNLVSGGNNITAHAGTTGSPTALADNTWGFAIAGVGSFDASYAAENNATGSATKWAGIPATGTPFQLKTTSAVATNDVTTVWYAAKVTSAQPTGTYTDQVIYTATAD